MLQPIIKILESLPQTIRERAICNYNSQKYYKPACYLDSQEKALVRAFTWQRSPEGWAYWNYVYDQLIAGKTPTPFILWLDSIDLSDLPKHHRPKTSLVELTQ